MMVPGGNSENGSTGRSAHDDGYGTESGSNQKVHTVSTNSICSVKRDRVISMTARHFLHLGPGDLLPLWLDGLRLVAKKERRYVLHLEN